MAFVGKELAGTRPGPRGLGLPVCEPNVPHRPAISKTSTPTGAWNAEPIRTDHGLTVPRSLPSGRRER